MKPMKSKVIGLSLLAASAMMMVGVGDALAQEALHGGKLQQVRLGADSGARFGDRYEDRRFSRDALRRFHDRVEWALSRGALTRSEADRLHFKANALHDLARAMARRNGLDYYERNELDSRFADLRAQFRRWVWDRDYRGSHRNEWRSARDREERYWRDDDRDDDDRSAVASQNDYAARGDNAAPDLNQSDDNWNPPELGKAPASSRVAIPPPQPYRAEAPAPPAPRKPAPSERAAPKPAAPAGDDQPFKDGRDFH